MFELRFYRMGQNKIQNTYLLSNGLEENITIILGTKLISELSF